MAVTINKGMSKYSKAAHLNEVCHFVTMQSYCMNKIAVESFIIQFSGVLMKIVHHKAVQFEIFAIIVLAYLFKFAW